MYLYSSYILHLKCFKYIDVSILFTYTRVYISIKRKKVTNNKVIYVRKIVPIILIFTQRIDITLYNFARLHVT